MTTQERVLFIAYFFPPAGGSGVQRSSKFVRYLPEHGFRPVVVTGPGDDNGRWTPPDPSLEADVADEVPVLRVQGPVPGDGAGVGWRARRFLRFPTPFDSWWSEGAARLGRRERGVSLVFASMSPFSTAPAAAQLARELGVPWVADLRDPWALDEHFVYPSAIHWQLERRRMRTLLGTAAAIVLPTPGMRERVDRFFPELAARTLEIRNGFDPADFAGPTPEPSDDRFHVVHAGYFYGDVGRRRLRRLLGGSDQEIDLRPHSPDFLLEALERLVELRPELRGRIRLHLAGPLTAREEEVVERARCRDLVDAYGYLPHAEALQLVRSADALFLPLHRLPNGGRSTIVPGKLYEYLASGRPILGAVPAGDTRDLLADDDWTVLCAPDDVAGLADGLLSLFERTAERRGKRADRQALLPRLARPHLAAELAKTFDRVLAEDRRAA
jgi:glycosyltransferase involved in cell wall biosynthesis